MLLACIKAHLRGRRLPHLIPHARAGGARSRAMSDKISEHISAHRDLGHLEGDVAAMAHDLRADLDQLLAQAGQRPRLRRFWHRQGAHEIAEVVGQRMELETRRGGEGRA